MPLALIPLTVSSPYLRLWLGVSERERPPQKIPDSELGHHGEEVLSDAMMRKYRLIDPSLALLPQIVRAADSYPSSQHASGERLRWIVHNLSTLGLSYHQTPEREFIIKYLWMPSAGAE